jgi:aldehyde dehydrogenase (NAD+)
VGNSGMGNYHGKWTLETFSHKKMIVNKSFLFDLKQMYPPYKFDLKILKKILKWF